MENIITFNPREQRLAHLDIQTNELLEQLRGDLPNSERIRIQRLIQELATAKKDYLGIKFN